MAETSTSNARRGPKPGRWTPRGTVAKWDRTTYKELRFSELTERIRDAEQGNVERWIDTTRRMLKTDPDLVSVVNTRLDRVASARYEVTPPDVVPKGAEDAAKRAAELVESYCFAELPDFEQVIRDLLDGIGTGFAVSEILWARRLIMWQGRRVGIWVPQDIVAVHPRRFAFTDDFRLALREDALTADLEGERVMTRGGKAVLLPADKYIVHQPRNILDYPTSTGLYMAVARQWWVKQWVTKYWLGGAERAANPRLHGTYPQGATDDVKEDLFAALESMSADAIGVSAEETSVTVHQGGFAGAHQTWDGLANRMAAMYAKAWLGSTLNVEVSDTGGNRALGESQADTTMDPRTVRDGKALWGDLRRYVIEPFLRFNSAPIGELFDVKPPVPVGRFLAAEDPVEISDLVVNTGLVTANQLLEAHGLQPLIGAQGDMYVVPGQGLSAEPGQVAPQPVAPRFSQSAEEADSPAPFSASHGPKPWELATRLGRALSKGAAATSTPSTKASKTKR